MRKILSHSQSIFVEASAKEMKMATWFEAEEDVDGLCLTIKAVKYSASFDGGKEIIIETNHQWQN